MGSRRASSSHKNGVGVGTFILCIALVMMMELVSSDINKDKEECAAQLAGLATCLPYVGGQAKAPTPDCCTGLRQVVKDNEKCVCILIKDRNDPSLGLNINTTLALTLPSTCHAPSVVGDCPALLHLAPNDPEAKVFNDFAKAMAAAPTTNTTTSPASPHSGSGKSAKQTNDGGKGKRRLMARMFYGVLVCCLAASMSHHLIL